MGGRSRAGAPKRGACSSAVLLRRRAAAVVVAAVACALAAGVVELGYLGSELEHLRAAAAWPCAAARESDRAGRARCGRARRGGRSLLALSAVAGRRRDRAGADDPPGQRRSRLPAHAAHPRRARARRCARRGHGPVPQPRGRERPRAARLRARRRCRRCRASGRHASGPSPAARCTRPRSQAALAALAARPRDFRAQVANVKVEPERGIVMRLRGGLDIVLGPPLALRATSCARPPGCCATTRRSADRAQSGVCRRLGARPARSHAARAAMRRPRASAEADEETATTSARKPLRMAPDARSTC